MIQVLPCLPQPFSAGLTCLQSHPGHCCHSELPTASHAQWPFPSLCPLTSQDTLFLLDLRTSTDPLRPNTNATSSVRRSLTFPSRINHSVLSATLEFYLCLCCATCLIVLYAYYFGSSGSEDKSDLDFKAWTTFRAQLSSLTQTETLILIKSVSITVSPENQKSLGPLSANLPLTSFAIPSSFSIPTLPFPTVQYSKSYKLKFKVLLNSVTFPCLCCHHLSPSGSHIIITWRAFTTFQWFPSAPRACIGTKALVVWTSLASPASPGARCPCSPYHL